MGTGPGRCQGCAPPPLEPRCPALALVLVRSLRRRLSCALARPALALALALDCTRRTSLHRPLDAPGSPSAPISFAPHMPNTRGCSCPSRSIDPAGLRSSSRLSPRPALLILSASGLLVHAAEAVHATSRAKPFPVSYLIVDLRLTRSAMYVHVNCMRLTHCQSVRTECASANICDQVSLLRPGTVRRIQASLWTSALHASSETLPLRRHEYDDTRSFQAVVLHSSHNAVNPPCHLRSMRTRFAASRRCADDALLCHITHTSRHAACSHDRSTKYVHT
ncbi:hypothetical protein K466DRAFT_387901 [Polyporus arcularius HHB13444]|uniref:Uncharacterized protein n=1 Tax=Polyporus arcularius HHB13444 TaxID=1314778 RepID=A0A5C3NW84_9APHY|nr:hypothetical protein K466DRAFT_387901 [Polyporus arcularius HHB13444]